MPRDFTVVAIVAAYNEADIIDHVVRDLLHQGIHVYFIDDGSTDGTAGIVERHLGNGVLAIERRADTRGRAAAAFEWSEILRRKSQLAGQIDASWFIHHDADEFRESPWPHLTLKAAIEHVDSLGFNAIDFMGLDFWPVDDRFRPGEDVREALTFCSPPAPYDRVQVRCWKKVDNVDLVSSGGHEARFAGRRVFPHRFLLRHYPIRGQAHGAQKILRERRSRFLGAERAQGWHRQYDEVHEETSFIRDPAALRPYDPDAARLSLAMHPRYPDELQEALCEARSETARLQREMAAREQELTELRADRVRLERDSAALGAEQTALLAELDRRAAEVERWRAAVDGLSKQLADVRASLTWRCHVCR